MSIQKGTEAIDRFKTKKIDSCIKVSEKGVKGADLRYLLIIADSFPFFHCIGNMRTRASGCMDNESYKAFTTFDTLGSIYI